MRKPMIAMTVVLALCAFGTAASAQSPAASYEWAGEVVSFDEAGKMLSIKARLVGQDPADEVKRFKAGERVVLLWSGFEGHADAVRSVTKYEPAPKQRFALPVELVAPAAERQYITVKVRVPDGSAARLKSVKAGEWVTVTSRHAPSTEADAVVEVRPYTGASRAPTN